MLIVSINITTSNNLIGTANRILLILRVRDKDLNALNLYYYASRANILKGLSVTSITIILILKSIKGSVDLLFLRVVLKVLKVSSSRTAKVNKLLRPFILILVIER
jgi:hypothetical protein